MNPKNINRMFLLMLISLSLLAGCRAFQPETMVVNQPPETYITGAPLEGGGGYYHYHVFWYGRDEDGIVEKFVWAVTDTSVQNEDTPEDEEDSRFNPVLNASHLESAHWTTKTDSIFDFQINNGAAISSDITFHIVAMDDYGNFDRTPARLHFFNNSLGSPVINFFRVTGTDTVALAHGAADTVGFGKPYHLYWIGSSPNVLGYDLDALAQVDTIYPHDDGLYGYKWRILGELGGRCQPSFEDCWHPRLFNEATGDSFSYYGEINSLFFANNGSSNTNPFAMELPSGDVNIQINTLDVAGVEVNPSLRERKLVVNYDPETIILQGRDWAHADGADPDTNTYPYYTLLNDATGTHYPFQEGARIPDRSYVVFKALTRDNPKDEVDDADFKIGLTGTVKGDRREYSGYRFTFNSGAGEIDYEPQWDAGLDGWYADTLGFLVGPRTEFTFVMQAVDEHERRDQTPPEFKFNVGFQPCVQCIELLPDHQTESEFPMDLECHDPDVPGHECFDDDIVFYVAQESVVQQPDRTYLTGTSGFDYLLINKSTKEAHITQSQTEPDDELDYVIKCDRFSMTVLLHGMDDPREAWLDPLNRVRAWKYQVDYECDGDNIIKDGGGKDHLIEPTWGHMSPPGASEEFNISPTDGLWRLTVDFFVPRTMVRNGLDYFWNMLYWTHAGQNAELADQLVTICLRQFSPGTIRAIALDQTICGIYPSRPAQYHLFDTVRPSLQLEAGETWRDCYPEFNQSLTLNLDAGAMDSAGNSVGSVENPAVQAFNLIFEDAEGVAQCGWTHEAN